MFESLVARHIVQISYSLKRAAKEDKNVDIKKYPSVLNEFDFVNGEEKIIVCTCRKFADKEGYEITAAAEISLKLTIIQVCTILHKITSIPLLTFEQYVRDNGEMLTASVKSIAQITEFANTHAPAGVRYSLLIY